MPIDEVTIEKEIWCTRAISTASEIQKTLHHFCDLLGFEQAWKYKEKGRTIVTQVNKGEFGLILAANLDRVEEASVFISIEH